MTAIPGDLRYGADHPWVRVDTGTNLARAHNDELTPTPELINADSYGQGWTPRSTFDPATLDQQLAGLMHARAYHDLAGD